MTRLSRFGDRSGFAPSQVGVPGAFLSPTRGLGDLGAGLERAGRAIGAGMVDLAITTERTRRAERQAAEKLRLLKLESELSVASAEAANEIQNLSPEERSSVFEQSVRQRVTPLLDEIEDPDARAEAEVRMERSLAIQVAQVRGQSMRDMSTLMRQSIAGIVQEQISQAGTYNASQRDVVEDRIRSLFMDASGTAFFPEEAHRAAEFAVGQFNQAWAQHRTDEVAVAIGRGGDIDTLLGALDDLSDVGGLDPARQRGQVLDTAARQAADRGDEATLDNILTAHDNPLEDQYRNEARRIAQQRANIAASDLRDDFLERFDEGETLENLSAEIDQSILPPLDRNNLKHNLRRRELERTMFAGGFADEAQLAAFIDSRSTAQTPDGFTLEDRSRYMGLFQQFQQRDNARQLVEWHLNEGLPLDSVTGPMKAVLDTIAAEQTRRIVEEGAKGADVEKRLLDFFAPLEVMPPSIAMQLSAGLRTPAHLPQTIEVLDHLRRVHPKMYQRNVDAFDREFAERALSVRAPGMDAKTLFDTTTEMVQAKFTVPELAQRQDEVFRNAAIALPELMSDDPEFNTWFGFDITPETDDDGRFTVAGIQDLPSGIVSRYQRDVFNLMAKGGRDGLGLAEASAQRIAYDQLRRTVGRSDLFGKSRIMAFPPEKVYGVSNPAAGISYGAPEIRREILASLIEDVKGGTVEAPFEFPTGPLTGPPPVGAPGVPPLDIVLRSQEKRVGDWAAERLVLLPDPSRTMSTAEGDKVVYNLGVRDDDGFVTPVMRQDGEPYRVAPLYEDSRQAKEDAQRRNQRIDRRRRLWGLYDRISAESMSMEARP